VCILCFGPHPEINLHPGQVCFSPWQRRFHRIAYIMGLGIMRALHHHEMRVTVFIEYRSSLYINTPIHLSIPSTVLRIDTLLLVSVRQQTENANSTPRKGELCP
jgi:hypothetical protein